MPTTPTPHDTRRTVSTFAWVSFLHDMGSDMIFSVWPLFLRNVLGASMTAVGIVDGLGDSIVSLSQAIGGYLSDRLRKRKVFVWVGYLFGGLSRIGYAFAPSWGWVVPFRLLDRSGKIRGTPRDAIVSDLSTRENRGRHFGVLRAMDNLGAVVGILLSLLLIGVFALPYRTVFLIAAVPSFLAVLLILVKIREPARPEGTVFRGIRLRDISGNLRLFMLASALFELGAFSYSFLMLAASDSGFGAGTIPALYLLFTFAAAVVSIPAGRLADRVGRKPLLLASYLGWALVALLFLSSAHPASIILAFVFYGLHKGAMDPVQKTLAAELAPKEFVASTLGGFQLVLGSMSLPSSFLAGFLWDRYGTSASFLAALCLTVVAGVLLLFVRERQAHA